MALGFGMVKGMPLRHLLLIALLVARVEATESTKLTSAGIREIVAPDTKSLWVTNKLASLLDEVIDAKEVWAFIKSSVATCIEADHDPLECQILDNLMSIKSAFNYRIIAAEWFSGMCGVSGMCTTLVYDIVKKRIVYSGATYGVTVLKGKLHAVDRDGKATMMKLKGSATVKRGPEHHRSIRH